MCASFNVLDCRWIPVIGIDGSRQLLGIRETLAKADKLLEISDPAPHEEFSVYRFLGLFLMDAIRPADDDEIIELYDSGTFNMDVIESYIDECQSEGVSFDLFDKTKPFLQSVYDEKIDKSQKSITEIDCTSPSGNNHTHFCHVAPLKYAPDRAVKLMLATYWFCTAEVQEYPSGVYGAPPYFGIIKGKNLFETLVSLLLPVDEIQNFDYEPVLWRRVMPVQPKKIVSKVSWLYGMLFPSRRISLVPDEDGNVVSVYICQGENFKEKYWKDPYVTYRTVKGKLTTLLPKSDTPIWRNFCDIIDIPGSHASQLLSLYRRIHNVKTVNLTLYGIETNQAKYCSVCRHNLQLPFELAEKSSVELLFNCIQASQKLYDAMRQRISKKNSKSKIKVIPESVVNSTLERYDQQCERLFWDLCKRKLNNENNRILYESYCISIADAALFVYDELFVTLNLRAHDLAQSELYRNELKKIGRELISQKDGINDNR